MRVLSCLASSFDTFHINWHRPDRAGGNDLPSDYSWGVSRNHPSRLAWWSAYDAGKVPQLHSLHWAPEAVGGSGGIRCRQEIRSGSGLNGGRRINNVHRVLD